MTDAVDEGRGVGGLPCGDPHPAKAIAATSIVRRSTMFHHVVRLGGPRSAPRRGPVEPSPQVTERRMPTGRGGENLEPTPVDDAPWPHADPLLVGLEGPTARAAHPSILVPPEPREVI